MSTPEILYLSHCVPYPPDKGEKIRSYNQLRQLSERFRVHLACFSREETGPDAARELSSLCASVFIDPLSTRPALLIAGIRFLAGACLNTAFYSSRRIHRRVRELRAAHPLAAAVAYTAVMFPYVPEGLPSVLDMLDVDSEKWFSYAAQRHPGFLYAIEARRMRETEIRFARQAALSLFTTAAEEQLFRSFSPASVRTGVVENGVDFDYFDPRRTAPAAGLDDRRLLVFTGSMDYHPNIDAVCWFVSEVLPELRRADPAVEFAIVGRKPAKAVLDLASVPGVRVTGGVPDVRPYLKAAMAIVAPLRIARGIQNKVLEGLAMGKPAYVSPEIARTFGLDLPLGVTSCDSPRDYLNLLAANQGPSGDSIREAARARFTWSRNNAALVDAVEALIR